MLHRSSGVLLHITSLPSRFGIGDLGPEARRFADFLAASGQRHWQILPLNPTSPTLGNSPYSSCSAFAGNPVLISPENMLSGGLLEDLDLDTLPAMPLGPTDYERAWALRHDLLGKAFQRMDSSPRLQEAFLAFCARHAHWLEDYALFIALKNHFQGNPWIHWPDPLRRRDPQAMAEFRGRFGRDLDLACFGQFVFYSQWQALREYCRERGIGLIGDIPIYVHEDSVDVWSNPGLFKLDKNLRPRMQAGVPPDYFSATGQLWGNPVYDWDRMREDGFAWWIRRIRHNTELFDLVRLDHFRGFVSFWEVPAGEKTAVRGQWAEVPTRPFMSALCRAFSPLPLIAEDLGTITDDVREVMREFSLPGMKILLFAFGPDLPTNPYTPHNHVRNCVVYTGTHDNNTVRGWFEEEADAKTRSRLEAYLGEPCDSRNVSRRLVRLAMQSVASLSILPFQDLLGLDGRSRMNIPGVADGHWTWRTAPGEISKPLAEKLLALTVLSGRTEYRQ